MRVEKLSEKGTNVCGSSTFFFKSKINNILNHSLICKKASFYIHNYFPPSQPQCMKTTFLYIT